MKEDNQTAMQWPKYRHLGNFAVSAERSIGLTCHHCIVSWNGCAAESYCPECKAPKGYYPDDHDDCYCHLCVPTGSYDDDGNPIYQDTPAQQDRSLS